MLLSITTVLEALIALCTASASASIYLAVIGYYYNKNLNLKINRYTIIHYTK